MKKFVIAVKFLAHSHPCQASVQVVSPLFCLSVCVSVCSDSRTGRYFATTVIYRLLGKIVKLSCFILYGTVLTICRSFCWHHGLHLCLANARFPSRSAERSFKDRSKHKASGTPDLCVDQPHEVKHSLSFPNCFDSFVFEVRVSSQTREIRIFLVTCNQDLGSLSTAYLNTALDWLQPFLYIIFYVQ